MPIYADFGIGKLEDGTLSVDMRPPVPIGGWSMLFFVQHRFGGISGIYQASIASGFNNMSGINITNSGEGQFNVSLPSIWGSGLDFGNYAYSCQRVDSGSRTILAEGFISLGVNTGM
jgi:hypothetical protein